jgi:hypothetical protein
MNQNRRDLWGNPAIGDQAFDLSRLTSERSNDSVFRLNFEGDNMNGK